MTMLKLVLPVAALLVALPAAAEDWDFVLTNAAGKTIKTIEIAATGTTVWQANKVAAVKSSDRTTVRFDKGADCKYDLKLTFDDDSSAVWAAINVCDNAYVTVKYSASGKPVFTAN